ncbi:hypothetical protein FIBSPDRAFT_871152 [Athelia psychrophila]|uniref:Uncharacterized protein n=1 Tax=Athelia psychrophila TaxID=1759441 RepID=A0A166AH22_9AGAM|nr:hypothetical protein FIBSPDRAFT_871152 [Fibularhizoctonia sp. CBS 109695]
MITVRYLEEMPACFLFVLHTCNGTLNKFNTTTSVSPSATISPQRNLKAQRIINAAGSIAPCSISLT